MARVDVAASVYGPAEAFDEIERLQEVEKHARNLQEIVARAIRLGTFQSKAGSIVVKALGEALDVG